MFWARFVHIGAYILAALLIFVFYTYFIISGNVNEMEWHDKCKWYRGAPSYHVHSYEFCDKFGKKYRYKDFDTHKYDPNINKELQ